MCFLDASVFDKASCCLKDTWGRGNIGKKAFGPSTTMKSNTISSRAVRGAALLALLLRCICFFFFVLYVYIIFLQSKYYCWYSGSSGSLHVTLHFSPFPGSICHSDISEHREWNHPEDATAGTILLGLFRVFISGFSF